MENLGALPLATINVAFNLPALYFVIAVVLALLVQFAMKKRREKRLDRTLQKISDVIADYFRKAGIEVSASCFSLLGGERFIAVIESEPIKKFRHSYIIEQSLVRHILKATGQQVEKIYWRFPFAPALEGLEETSEQEPKAMDPYLAERPAQMRMQNGYLVEETSWDNYENAVHTSGDEAVGPPLPGKK